MQYKTEVETRVYGQLITHIYTLLTLKNNVITVQHTYSKQLNDNDKDKSNRFLNLFDAFKNKTLANKIFNTTKLRNAVFTLIAKQINYHSDSEKFEMVHYKPFTELSIEDRYDIKHIKGEFMYIDEQTRENLYLDDIISNLQKKCITAAGKKFTKQMLTKPTNDINQLNDFELRVQKLKTTGIYLNLQKDLKIIKSLNIKEPKINADHDSDVLIAYCKHIHSVIKTLSKFLQKIKKYHPIKKDIYAKLTEYLGLYNNLEAKVIKDPVDKLVLTEHSGVLTEDMIKSGNVVKVLKSKYFTAEVNKEAVNVFTKPSKDLEMLYNKAVECFVTLKRIEAIIATWDYIQCVIITQKELCENNVKGIKYVESNKIILNDANAMALLQLSKPKSPKRNKKNDNIAKEMNNVVKNDYFFTKSNININYGNNGNGKSYYSLNLLLSIVLAQCGIFVGINESTVPVFDTVVSHINNIQSMDQSSFSTEADFICYVETFTNMKTLIFADEFLSFTNHQLASTILNNWLERITKHDWFLTMNTNVYVDELPPQNLNIHYMNISKDHLALIIDQMHTKLLLKTPKDYIKKHKLLQNIF